MYATDNCGETGRVFEVLTPPEQSLPVVLASPHSGRDYSPQFVASTRLDPMALRKSEDSFVDEIFDQAPLHGVPLLKALFPRAFIDTNREAFELDPDMFDDHLPEYVNTRSPRVIAGLGTIAKVVAHGEEIYNRKLSFDEALRRIDRHYRPYHEALTDLVERTRKRFGYCLLIDCHSMPSGGTVVPSTMGRAGPGLSGAVDFVLGDCHGRACAPAVINCAERWLVDHGYAVVRNTPYAGGFTTRHYGRPAEAVHAFQLEINRSLYMDEADLTRKPYLRTLAEQMAEMIDTLAQIDPGQLRPM